MPRRSRHPRWVLVTIAVAGLSVGTAAAAQATESHASTPTIVFPGIDIPTLPSVSARPATVPASVGANAVPAGIVLPELTLADFGLAPTRPPAQRPTANPPSTPPASGPRDQAPAAAPAVVAAAPSGTGGDGAGPPPAPRPDARRQAPRGTDEVALPSADWRFSDGRALVAPPLGSTTGTAPVWWAVLVGLAGGIGLTATASLVVNRLDRGRVG